MSDDWEMVVRVRIRNCIERDLPDAREILADCIRDDGGVWSVLSGWCEPEDMEILSLEPAGAHPPVTVRGEPMACPCGKCYPAGYFGAEG